MNTAPADTLRQAAQRARTAGRSALDTSLAPWWDAVLVCERGHVWRYRAGRVTGPNGHEHQAAELWARTTGRPRMFELRNGCKNDYIVRCPRCFTECAPSIAALRD